MNTKKEKHMILMMFLFLSLSFFSPPLFCVSFSFPPSLRLPHFA